MEQDIAAQVVGLGGATDFSLWKLFLRADFVVKFVIILLIDVLNGLGLSSSFEQPNISNTINIVVKVFFIERNF